MDTADARNGPAIKIAGSALTPERRPDPVRLATLCGPAVQSERRIEGEERAALHGIERRHHRPRQPQGP